MRRGIGAAGVLLVGCWGDPKPPAEPTEVVLTSVMERHYTHALAAHDHVVSGDLAQARAELEALTAAPRPDAFPATWEAADSAIREAARGPITDLPTAAATVARVASTCGNCHSSLGRGPAYPYPPLPEADDAVMRRHAWAVDRLWEGVTGPRPDAWARGCDVLVTQGLGADLASAGTPEAAAFQASVTGCAESPDPALRYGQVLATCAGCHSGS